MVNWIVPHSRSLFPTLHPPRIRVLDDILGMLLGGKERQRGVDLLISAYQVIDPDGSINKNDDAQSAFGTGPLPDFRTTEMALLNCRWRMFFRNTRPNVRAYHADTPNV
jgi:hypothetical protein